MSDITAFQYLRREDDEFHELKDRELEEWLANRVQLRVPSLVTSTTRPTTNLFRGMRIFETDTGNEYVYYGATTTWQRPWVHPWGPWSSASASADQSGISSLTDLTSLSCTFTAVANRRYQIDASIHVTGSTVGNAYDIRICDGSGALIAGGNMRCRVDDTTIAFGRNWSTSWIPGAGSVTAKLRAQIASGAGTVTISNATFSGLITVTDIGPTGSAPAA